MKSIINFIIILCLCTSAFGQKPIREEVAISGVKEIVVDFKYPKLVKVKSWDGNKILITGTAMINMGTHDDNFKINSEQRTGQLFISSEIEDMESIPRRVWVENQDGTIHSFNTSDWNNSEVQQYLAENPGHKSVSNGIIRDIKLEVFVPRNMALNISCKFGLLEIRDFDAPLRANAKFGGIDIAFLPKKKADIEAKSKFGEIYSNLDVKFRDPNYTGTERNKWLVLQSKMNGGGMPYVLESKHGNLYLRKN